MNYDWRSNARNYTTKQLKNQHSWRRFWCLLLVIFLLISSGSIYTVHHLLASDLQTVYLKRQDGSRYVPAHIDNHKLKRLKFCQQINIIDRYPLQQRYQHFLKLYQTQLNLQTDIQQYYDGPYNYTNGLSQSILDNLNNRLYRNNNPHFYWQQKAKIDVLNVWLLETTNSNLKLEQFYQKFIKTGTTQIEQMLVLYNLLHNKQIKKSWKPRVQAVKTRLQRAEQAKSSRKKAAEKNELETLKKQPLTDNNYPPAIVTIQITSKFNKKANDDLLANNIHTPLAIYINTNKQQLGLMQYQNKQYKLVNKPITYVNNTLPINTQWKVLTILKANSNTEMALVTDNTLPDFGQQKQINSQNFQQYYHQPNAWANISKNEADFNTARPLFWLTNLPAGGISLISGSLLGIISNDYRYQNTLNLSTADLETLSTAINSDTMVLVE